jgi:hypothetical protein
MITVDQKKYLIKLPYLLIQFWKAFLKDEKTWNLGVSYIS